MTLWGYLFLFNPEFGLVEQFGTVIIPLPLGSFAHANPSFPLSLLSSYHMLFLFILIHFTETNNFISRIEYGMRFESAAPGK